MSGLLCVHVSTYSYTFLTLIPADKSQDFEIYFVIYVSIRTKMDLWSHFDHYSLEGNWGGLLDQLYTSLNHKSIK